MLEQGRVVHVRPRGWRRWLAVTLAVALVWLGAIGVLAYAAWQQMHQGLFPYWALPAGLLLFPLPWLGYILWLLLRAGYTLDALGLHVRWGRELRTLPWSEVLWVGPLRAYPVRIILPGRPLIPDIRLGYTEDGRTVFVFALGQGSLLVEGERTGLWLLAPQSLAAFTTALQRFLETDEKTPPVQEAPAEAIVSRPSAPPASSEEGEAAARAPAGPRFPLSPWRQPRARVLLLANLALGLLVFLVWMALAVRVPRLQELAPVLIAHGGFLGLEFALAFWMFVPRPRLAFMLWGTALLTNVLLLLVWVMYSLL